MKIRYQCVACGKFHETREEAEKCHGAPVQGIIQGVARWPKPGFFGN